MIRKFAKSFLSKLNPNRVCVPDHKGQQFEVKTWTISEFILNKIIPIVGVHPFPLNELSLLVSAVCRIQPSHIFEWGTNVGTSARIFYESVNYFKIDCEIHTIDLPDDIQHVEHPGQHRGELIKGIKKVYMHQGDGATTALSLWDTATKKGKPLFFLDGDHSYESVQRELKSIFGQVESASFLIHDTLFQSEESLYNVGPFRAVNDFLESTPNLYDRIEERLGLPGMTLLYRRDTAIT
jgi:cephalosporin hydroxylase